MLAAFDCPERPKWILAIDTKGSEEGASSCEIEQIIVDNMRRFMNGTDAMMLVCVPFDFNQILTIILPKTMAHILDIYVHVCTVHAQIYIEI